MGTDEYRATRLLMVDRTKRKSPYRRVSGIGGALREIRAMSSRPRLFWVIAKQDNGRIEILILCSGGERVLPVFGFREEAETFVLAEGLDGWYIRETCRRAPLTALRALPERAVHYARSAAEAIGDRGCPQPSVHEPRTLLRVSRRQEQDRVTEAVPMDPSSGPDAPMTPSHILPQDRC